MTTKYFMPRPNTIAGVQWDGTNLAEITALIESQPSMSWWLPIVDNGDGTVTTTLSDPSESRPVFGVGSWFTTNGAYTPEQFAAANYQELPAAEVTVDVTAVEP